MSFLQHAQHTLIPGESGQIELKIAWQSTHAQLVLICHPHPLQGGSMDNKVVSTLANTCFRLGMTVVVFNFRGVGASMGVFDAGVGETTDAQTVIHWVLAQQKAPISELVLMGFSFGSMVANNLYRTMNFWDKSDQVNKKSDQVKMGHLVLLAPPVDRYRYHATAQQLTYVIIGDSDDVVSPTAVLTWCQQQQYSAYIIANAGHFFHGRLTDLAECVQKIMA